jgi:hypothetical protein
VKQARLPEPELDPPRPAGLIARTRWRFRRRNPLNVLPYLEEPNYYRIAYQLAAQQVHDGLSPPTSNTRDATVRTPAPPARQVAEDLVHHADHVLAWFDWRTRRRWSRMGLKHKLTPNHQRLRAFLDKTIEPSARLLLAGIDLDEGQLSNAEMNAEVVRERSVDELSHRALYNLSCYEAQLAAAQQWNAAAAKRCLEALEDALRSVYGHDRAELVRWADKDPAFTSARRRPDFGAEFAALLATYPAPEENAPTTEPADEPKSLIERIMRLVRRWLGLDRGAR